jgi:uncharacterized protein YndB with AHSA1/START domain
MQTTSDERAILNLSRTLRAPRERVFQAWTDPEEIKRWFGPDSCQVIEASLDLRVGGGFRFRFRDAEQSEYYLSGEFREVTPPGKLVYTWQWENDAAYVDRETVVSVEFIDLGASTEVRLVHENLPSEQSAENHEHGWSGSLDKLEKLL